MTARHAETLHKKQQNKNRTVVLSVNGKPFEEEFPNERADFDDYTSAFRSVQKLVGSVHFRIHAQKMHPSLVKK